VYRPEMTRCLLILFAVAVGSRAQPGEMPSPEVVIEILRAEYRSAPIAEEVTVQVGRDIARRIGRATVRLNATDPARPRLRIDLTPLEIWCDGPRLVAVSSRNDTLAVERRLPGPPSLDVLATVMRPVALPQLELAFSSDERLSSPTPFTPDVRWLQVIEGRRDVGGPTMLILLGQWGDGREIRLYIDKETDRLRGLEARLGDEEGHDALELKIDIRPEAIGGVGQWTITTEGRQLTERLIDLTPRRGPVSVGELCPELTLIRPGGTSWSLTDELARAKSREPLLHALCFVLHRFEQDDRRLSANVRWAQAALDAIGPEQVDPWRLARHAGRIYDLVDFGGGVAAPEWDSVRHGPLHTDHSPSRSIDWFAEDARAVLVLVGMDRRIIHISTFEGDQTPDPEQVDILAPALRALSAAFPIQSVVDDPAENADQQPSDSPQDPPGP